MLRYIGIVFVFLLIAARGRAQTPQPRSQEHRVQGYGYIGPGAFTTGSETLIHYGAGVEGMLAGGLGVCAELGGFAPAASFRDGFGVFSPNASYHFLNGSRSRKFAPFVTGGYTLFFRSGVANGMNFGGGFNYWFKERVGVRVEVRDHILFPDSDSHLIGVRLGVSFR
jgi:hypothetical protein